MLRTIIVLVVLIIGQTTDASNLVTNPGFEYQSYGWQKTSYSGRSIVTGQSYSGVKSLQMLVSSQWSRQTSQDINIVADQTYDVSCRLKTLNIHGEGATIFLLWLDDTGVGEDPQHNLIRSDTLPGLTGTNDWKLLSGSFVAPNNAQSVRLMLYTDSDPEGYSGTVWFDDCELIGPSPELDTNKFSSNFGAIGIDDILADDFDGDEDIDGLDLAYFIIGLNGNVILLKPDKTFQTMTGWETSLFAAQDSPFFIDFRDDLYDLTINETGINRIRLEIRSGSENSRDYYSEYIGGRIDYQTWRANRYATVNDNDDPNDINWNGFHFTELDELVTQFVTPLQQRMKANNEDLHINLLYVAFTNQITMGGAYHHNNSNEYSEFILANLIHLRDTYSITPNTIEVILEPDQVGEWNGTLIGQAILATRSRLEANGFHNLRFITPSTLSMANAIAYFDDVVQVLGPENINKYIEEISYHRYNGVVGSSLETLAGEANRYGINTAMLEWWSNLNGYETLLNDLKMGNNSSWQHGAIGSIGNPDSSMDLYKINLDNPDNPIIMINKIARFCRQYYKFIRKGAVRIEAKSNNSSFNPIAFINKDGRHTVVVKANTAGIFTINGLPSGVYGIRYTTAGHYNVDAGDQSLAPGRALETSIPEIGVITIYGK